MKRNIFYFGIFCTGVFLLLCSCRKENGFEYEKFEENFPLKKHFAIVMAKTMENVSVRKFIKTEAMKQFDKDFDILYHAVKNRKLDNGLTFRDYLLTKFNSEDDLIAIENTFPLLTIFVPSLPENSFSAEYWDVNTQIPKVAVRSLQTNKVPIYNAFGLAEILDASLIPSFPVIVIKDNERVREKHSQTGMFEFLDRNFDPSWIECGIEYPTLEIEEAYDICKNTAAWQRDYLYYTISPGNTTGKFRPEYTECFTSLNFPEGTGTSRSRYLYSKIVKNWTQGNVEFRIKINLADAKGFAYELIRYFQLEVDELFQIQFEKKGKYFGISEIGNKKPDINLPLFSWNLHQFTSAIKVGLEIHDRSAIIETKHTGWFSFFDNFIIEDGIVIKTGMGNGNIPLKPVLCEMMETETLQTGNELGEAVINFGDPILIGNAQLMKYSTGTCEFYVVPQKIDTSKK